MSIPNKIRLIAVVVLVLASIAIQAQANAQGRQSMEERLRAELRNVTAQLQQARGELESLKAAPVRSTPVPAAAPVADSTKKDLARSQTQLAEQRAEVARLQAEQQRGAQETAGEVARYRQSGEQLSAAAKSAQAERVRLDAELAAQTSLLGRCEARNTQLYAVGQDILRAYESLDIASVLRARQPFAAQSRVRLEQVAQEYGDQLYRGRFDRRATDAPANTATPAPASAAAAAAQ